MTIVTRLSQATPIKIGIIEIKIGIVETPVSNRISRCGGRGRHDRKGADVAPARRSGWTCEQHINLRLDSNARNGFYLYRHFPRFMRHFPTCAPRVSHTRGNPSVVLCRGVRSPASSLSARFRGNASGPACPSPRPWGMICRAVLLGWPRSARLSERMRSGAVD